jgi:tetratricopeptide (TPR) repeat protein
LSAGILDLFLSGAIASMLGTLLPDLYTKYRLSSKQDGEIASNQALDLTSTSKTAGPLSHNKGKKTDFFVGLILIGLSVLGLPNCIGWGTVAASTSQQELGRGSIAIREVPVPPTQVGNASSQIEGNAESVHDDPQQIANFEDLILKENFQEVDALLRSYLAAHPRSWKAYYFLGYVQLRQHRIADSIKALAKSLELNVNNAEAHKLLGKDLSIIGRYDVATREFEQALRLDPSLAEVHYNLGKVYSIQDDFHEARKEFEKAIWLNPNYVEAHNALGFAMEALGDDVAAFDDYQAALRLNEERHGKFVAPYINLSGYYNRRGELDLAMGYAKKALEMNPKSDLAYFQIAKAYRAKKEWNGEAEALENAIAIKPSSSQYHYALGIAYRRLGKIKESEQALEGFRNLEKQTADLENQRREARRSALGLELRPDE